MLTFNDLNPTGEDFYNKQKLPFDGELIEDVIKFHIRKMSEELTKVRPWKRRIYIHSWGYIEVFPYVFNPYSLYYDHQKTMKFIKKYQKIRKFF